MIERIRSGLAGYNAEQPGSSTRIERVLLLAAPPSIDADEVTDKGYIHQRATLESRADAVDRLCREPPGDDVILVP